MCVYKHTHGVSSAVQRTTRVVYNEAERQRVRMYGGHGHSRRATLLSSA